MNGTVKFYNRTKRFGFVSADDGKEYFFHESGLEPGTNVKDNDKVTFDVVDGDRGKKAEHIKLSTGVSDDSEETEETETSEEPVEEDTEDETDEEE